jgi:AcrR family transcriptional regulator
MEHSFASFKLPPGRHGLSREHVSESQRWRLLAAAVELLAEGGYRSLTSHKVARRAAVSSQAFYAHFRDIEDCLVAVAEVGAKNLELAVDQGCDKNTAQLPEPIAGAIGETLALLAREPFLQRLFSLETRSAAPMMWRAGSRLIASLATRLLRVLEFPDGQASIRCHLLVHAAVVTASEASAAELSPGSELADQLAKLVAIGARGVSHK